MAIKTKYQAETALTSDWQVPNNKPTVLLVGPYISNYSFAKMNRGLITALAKQKDSKFKYAIWQNPGRWVDKLPSNEDLKLQPEVAALLTNEPGEPEVTIFNSFPSNPAEPYGLADLPGKYKVIHIAWEETIFPSDKVNEINENMHMVWATTNHVKRILRQNGVTLPIEIVPVGIDDRFLKYTPGTYPLQTSKSVKFLHISSARVRKGVDVMLEAYFAEFSGSDDVSLIIKSFPGPDNLVNDLLGKLRKEHSNPPEVIHIFNPDLREEEIIDLINSTTASLYPTRAEGFGMPILEAMYLKQPVIVTGYSGHMDFCNAENSLLVDYSLVDASNSELSNIGAKWAEPSVDSVRARIRFVYDNAAGTQLKQMGALAHTEATKYSWAKIAAKAAPLLEEISQIGELKKKKLAVMTTYNTVSGISEYSFDLYRSILGNFEQLYFLANSDATDQIRADSESVIRLWEQGQVDASKVLTWLSQNRPDVLHIQYHSGEMSPIYLHQLLDLLKKELPQVRTVITPHDTLSKGANSPEALTAYKLADLVIVHKQTDFESLSRKGLSNLVEFPLPYDEYTLWEKQKLRQALGLEEIGPILVTHGIASFHKGLLQTADAVAELKKSYPDILWLAVNAININNVSSSDTIDKLRARISALGLEDNVRLFTDFLDADAVLALIQTADIGVLAYDEVGESASAAVRKFLASGTPTIVTDIPIMSELTDEVYKIENNSPEAIVEAAKAILENSDLGEKVSKSALATSARLSWERQARKLLGIYSKLIE